MKVHKFTIYVIDPNYEQSSEDLKVNIENGFEDQIVHYGEIESKEIGEWDDDNFWNFDNHRKDTLEKEFKSIKV